MPWRRRLGCYGLVRAAISGKGEPVCLSSAAAGGEQRSEVSVVRPRRAAYSARPMRCRAVSLPFPSRLSPQVHSLLALVVLLVGGGLWGGCTRQIGDACKTNLDCNITIPNAFCDLASPEGYCTIEGCDSTSCPDGSTCIRFFSLERGNPTCDASRPCRSGERCLCDDEACTRAYCASETSERRWCMRRCEVDAHCRGGYSCRASNQGGAISAIRRDASGTPVSPVELFCAPAPG